MHVGLSVIFQNPGRSRPDHEVYADELRLARQAEPLGFDSIWSVEHHFTDYTMCPDVLQFLTYMAGCTEHIQLGSMVCVLPWHDPLRVAEQLSMLDALSGGRVIFGIGRGTGRVEFDGFRVEMPEARARFAESAEMILTGLEQGVVEYDGEYIRQPRVDLRPAAGEVVPGPHLRSRDLAGVRRDHGADGRRPADHPPEAVEGAPRGARRRIAASTARPTARSHRRRSAPVGRSSTSRPTAPRRWPASTSVATGTRVVEHYEFDQDHLSKTPGYEFHGQMYDRLTEPGGKQRMLEFFLGLQVWGTPEQVYDKIVTIQDNIYNDAYMAVCSYAGMPYDEAERNMHLFAREVMPELKQLAPAYERLGIPV